MTVQVFLTLLMGFSAVTSLTVQALKKLLEGKTYSANMLACIVACLIGWIGTAMYYILNGMEFTPANIVYMILMGFASAIGAMQGYDRVKQTFEQLKLNGEING